MDSILKTAALEKQATLLFHCGKKYLIEMGFEKEASNPQIVIKFLERVKEAENIELYKQALEKRANFDFGKFWKGSLKPALKWLPEQLKMKPETFYGGLGGAALGGLGGYLGGRNWQSALAGGAMGGIGGGFAGQKWGRQPYGWLQQKYPNVFGTKTTT